MEWERRSLLNREDRESLDVLITVKKFGLRPNDKLPQFQAAVSFNNDNRTSCSVRREINK